MTNARLATQFHDLFAGFTKAHGRYDNIQPDHGRTDGKYTGKATTVRQPVTDELWTLHIEGKAGLGIIPIREDNTACFGAIDIDVYDGLDPAQIAAKLQSLNLPLIPCRSKSGGVHVYLFANEAVPASQMQKKLREIAALLGHGQCEIFPKQGTIRADDGDLGSWINMPYADASNTTRYAVKPDGDAFTAEEFLAHAETLKVKADFFNATADAGKGPAEFKDGPPCLGTLVQIGFPEGSRNEGLYNIAVYIKKRFPDEWEKRLYEHNERFMQPPLASSEVQGLIGSFKRDREYKYKCSQSPIMQHCNSGVCRTRKYGVGGGMMPDFGSLAQQKGDTITWFWTINGERIKLTTDELFRFHKFRERCAEVLKIVVPGMKQTDWDGVISRAMENCEDIPVLEDTTAAGALWELVEDFCTRYTADSMDEMLAGVGGQAFETGDGRTYFRFPVLMDFLKRKRFQDLNREEIKEVLERHKAVPVKDNVKRDGKRTTVHYWSVPTPAKPRTLEVPLPLANADQAQF